MTSCADGKWFKDQDGNSVYVDTYGLITRDKKVDGVHYEVSTGNVVWSILLAESIVAPVYFLGFSLYEPVCLESEVQHLSIKK